MGFLDNRGALAVAASDDIFGVGDTDDINPATGMRVIKWIERDNIFGQGLGTSDVPEFDGLTISSDDGIDINPGSDADADLITVGVTDTPRLWWDESEDRFILTKRLEISGTGATLGGSLQFPNHTGMNVKDTGGTYRLIFYLSNTDHTVITAPDTNQDIQFKDAGFTDLMVVDTSSGGVRVGGGSAASGQLHVDQSSATGAKPVIYLDQADISEEYLTFVGQSDGASADRSLVDPSEFTTPGALLVWIKNRVLDVRGGGGVGFIDIWIPGYAIPTL